MYGLTVHFVFYLNGIMFRCFGIGQCFSLAFAVLVFLCHVRLFLCCYSDYLASLLGLQAVSQDFPLLLLIPAPTYFDTLLAWSQK